MRILEAVFFDIPACGGSVGKEIVAEIDANVRVFSPVLFKK